MNRRFEMSSYARPRNDRDRQTLAEHGYRTLSTSEALKFVDGMQQMTLGDEKIGNLPDLIRDGTVELRYYKDGASDINKKRGKEKGNRVFVYFREVNAVLPATLRDGNESFVHKIQDKDVS